MPSERFACEMCFRRLPMLDIAKEDFDIYANW